MEIKLTIEPSFKAYLLVTVECLYSDDLRTMGICKERNGDKLNVANHPVDVNSIAYRNIIIEVIHDIKRVKALFTILKPNKPTNYVAYIKVAGSPDKIYSEIVTIGGE